MPWKVNQYYYSIKYFFNITFSKTDLIVLPCFFLSKNLRNYQQSHHLFRMISLCNAETVAYKQYSMAQAILAQKKMTSLHPGPAPCCEKCGEEAGAPVFDSNLQLWRAKCSKLSSIPLSSRTRKWPHEAFSAGKGAAWHWYSVIPNVSERAKWSQSVRQKAEGLTSKTCKCQGA